ncbi:hypothetical protein LPJ56_000708 [Coemansia sp. RSA 2599]|nr:hypothetical protein LPJ75_000372 [Coemansia sp. RSA 2598]KAJ1829017.1 hypothetical protein LPJ56_000708 [Coemansia sp. RSA 2599]
MADKQISIAGRASRKDSDSAADPADSKATKHTEEPEDTEEASRQTEDSSMDTDAPDAPLASDPEPKSSAAIAQQSIEGWVLVATGIHEEAREEDLQDFFADYGKVRSLHLNLDRLTGYVKGYALIEYATEKEALAAVQKASGKKLLGRPVVVDFAFVKDPEEKEEERKGRGNRRAGRDDQRDGFDRLAGRLGLYDESRRHGGSRPSVDRTRELSPDRGF